MSTQENRPSPEQGRPQIKSAYDEPDPKPMSSEAYDDILSKLSLVPRRGGPVPEKTVDNLGLILEQDHALDGLRLNTLSGIMEVHAKPPWQRDGSNPYWDENDSESLRKYIKIHYGLQFNSSDVDKEVGVLANQDSHRYNPVVKKLESLPPWDGTPRVKTLFIDYFGATDTVYSREVATLMILAAIKRAYQPACKFDNMPVLVGSQGLGKSTFFKALAMDPAFFTDSLSFADMTSVKTAGEKLQGIWIAEVAELSGIRKQDIDIIKNFLSSTNDLFREAYGRTAKPHPRQSIIVGSTNADQFLFDVTGNRRFWPIKCHEGQIKYDVTKGELTPETVQQIWAEGMALFLKDEDVTLTLSSKAEEFAEQAQQEATDTNDLEGVVEYYLDMFLPQDWDDMTITQRRTYIQTYVPEDPEQPSDRKQRAFVTIQEVFCECLGQPIDRLNPAKSKTISRCLTALHWLPGSPEKQTIPRYGRQRVRYRPPKREYPIEWDEL